MTKEFIAGSGGGGKGGGGGSRTPSTDEDSLNSRSFARILDLISEGQIEGLVDGNKSIFLDNTPLEDNNGNANFDDVIVRTRTGTSTQAVLPGFTQAVNVIPNPQSGVEIDSSGQTFTITDDSVDSVKFLISIPTLQKIKNNGDTLGTEFKFLFKRSLANGAFVNKKVNGKTIQKIKGRTADLYQKEYEFNISNLNENQFPVAFKVVRHSTAGDNSIADDVEFMNADDEDGDPNSDTYISHTSKFFVTSHSLIKNQGKNFVNASYTINNGSGGQGKIVTITTGKNHNLEVGESIGCEFTSGTNKPKNRRMEVTSVISKKVFTCEHGQNGNTSGLVTFGRRFSYPDSALVGLRIDAEQFNSVPRRSYLIKGIKVRIPAAYTSNGVTYTPTVRADGSINYPNGYIFNGSLGAAQWTTDPAWCLLDLLITERYGCGDFIKLNQLDLYSFYAASVYCSERVTFEDRLGTGVVETITEPRFSLNVNIQSRQDAFKVINSICSVFRAMPLYVSGSFGLIQDKAGMLPTHQFTEANVTPEGFSYSGSSSKTRTTVVVVKYFDLELRDAAYEQVIDNENLAKYGAIIKNINSFGVTSRGQARRLGKWFLTTLATETDIVSFTTNITAGAFITPGQIIEIADPVKSGVRRGGQIMGVETTDAGNSLITVDSVIDMPTIGGGVSATLTVILPDGQISQRPITNINTETKKIRVSGRFRKLVADTNGTEPFLPNTRQQNPDYITTTQTTDPNVGSFWVVEVTGGTSSILSQLYKVISVEEQDDFQYTITAVLHNESKYAAVEENEVLEHRDFTNLDLKPSAPSDWATDSAGTAYPFEQLYKDKNKVRVRLLIGWKPVLGVNRYELKYRKDSKPWTVVHLVDPTYSIDDIKVSKSGKKCLYDLRVKSISGSGKKSSNTLILNDKQVFGKTTLPSQVNSDFSATLDPNLGVVLSWTPIVATYPNFSDLDVRGYIIYEGDYGTGNLLGEVTATSFNVPTLPATGTSSQTFSIKAIDDDGNVSAEPRTATVSFGTPNQPSTFTGQYNNNNYILSWSASVVDANKFAINEYEIYQNDILIATVNSLSFTLPVTWNTQQVFKIKAVDIIGNKSSFKTFTASFNKAAAPNIAYSYEGSKIRLSWTKPAEGNTKIQDYVIKAGATTLSGTNEEQYAEAVAVDVTNSESYLLEVDHAVLNVSTGRRFFVVARDINNNLGDVGRTGVDNYPDVSVTAPPAPNNLTAEVVGASAFVQWDEVPIATLNGVINGLPIASYKIYREAANATSAGIADFQQNGTAVTEEVIWTDTTQKYFVRAVDVNGNEGALSNVNFTVILPSPVTGLNDEVIDNNVLLRWTESAVGEGQLPISHYNIYRDSTANNNLVGQKLGTFTTVFESIGGEFEYILIPVNTAGNEGASASIISTVNEPPDFKLVQDFSSSLNGTIVNGFTEGGGIFFCIDTSRTWKQHFDPNDNDTSRTFGVNGANNVYALPSENTGSYEEIVDTGATIPNTKIEATLGLVAEATVGDGYTITPEIFIAPDIRGTYVQSGTTVTITITNHGKSQGDQVTTEYRSTATPQGSPVDGTFTVASVVNANVFTVTASNSATDNGEVSIGSGTYVSRGANKSKVLAQNFRFIKVHYDFTGVDNNDLIKVNSLRVKTFLKQFTDQGRVDVTQSESDNLGKLVEFEKSFVDVDSIQLTIQGKNSQAKYAIYDFEDTANPSDGFRVFLFDIDGEPVAGTVDFTVRGV